MIPRTISVRSDIFESIWHQFQYYKMLKKVIVFCILLVTVVDAYNDLSRCCYSGGLMRYVNGSVECKPFFLPSTLNEAPAYLNVTIDAAKTSFQNNDRINDGYLCREIVFDKKSGLVLKTIIAVSEHVNETEQTFTDLQRYQVKRCCTLNSYHRTTGVLYEKNCTNSFIQNIVTVEEFSKYYNPTDYESKLNCSTYLKCFHQMSRLYILGDAILEMVSLKKMCFL